MFTPPPSPLPVPRIILTSDENSGGKKTDLLDVPPISIGDCEGENSGNDMRTTSAVHTERYLRKQINTRRIRWTILLVPAVLVLIALTTRRLSGMHRVFGETERQWPSFAHDRRHVHKRSPQAFSLTDPAAPTEASVLATSASNSASQTISQSTTLTTTISQTQQTIPPVPVSTAVPTPFPQPFDTTGATSNVTLQSCANALTNMTQSDEFRACRPLSLLSTFSNTFIQQSQQNLSNLNAILWGTCNTTISFDDCISNLGWFADQLESACSREVSDNDVTVTQTIVALRAYPIMRSVGCLVNQQTNTYCYELAVHDQSPYDLYLYSIPLGIGMPPTVSPSCSSCAGNLFSLYSEALQTGNSSVSGLKETYESAAQAAVNKCGNGYAELGVSASSASNLWRAADLKSHVILALGIILGVALLHS